MTGINGDENGSLVMGARCGAVLSAKHSWRGEAGVTLGGRTRQDWRWCGSGLAVMGWERGLIGWASHQLGELYAP
jgi:hypothetical protein